MKATEARARSAKSAKLITENSNETIKQLILEINKEVENHANIGVFFLDHSFRMGETPIIEEEVSDALNKYYIGQGYSVELESNGAYWANIQLSWEAEK